LRTTFFLFFIVLSSAVSAQENNPLVRGFDAGPMIGHTTDTSAKIWLMVKNIKTAELTLAEKENSEAVITKTIRTDTIFGIDKVYPLIFSFNNLKPETEYLISIRLDKTLIKKRYPLKTFSSDKIKDFSFLIGSCAFTPPRWLRHIYPGIGEMIYTNMSEIEADLMLWLGDNVYYLGKDYKSTKGMFKKQSAKRKMNKLNNFFQTGLPQYAIWDDHDFGYNNSNGNFNLKDEALKVNEVFWPNPYFGSETTKGAFSKFSLYDADFFLLDGRYYKTDENAPGRTMLGKQQREWFLSELKKSEATFKFVAVGTQVIPKHQHECLEDFPEEKKEIYDFIRNNNISGIVFLTGDIHHTVLTREKISDTQYLYDYTSSPLTSIVYDINNAKEIYKDIMIPETYIVKNNFGKIRITGEKGNRTCTFECYDAKAKKVWEHSVNEHELK
jgi:alkaline phosphatase D